MSIRKIDFVKGEYYHIYNRGNSKQRIFLDDKDRQRFLKLLYLCNSRQRIDFSNDIVKRKIDAWNYDKGESIVTIGAWVLMPNHFHLYITLKTEARLPSGNAISDFMHRILTGYSKYFNTKYKRTGSLFEGKFKSVHMKKDTQAKYLFSYIHLNPIKLINSEWKKQRIKDKRKILKFLHSYKWSSYLDYLEFIRPESKLVNKINFLNYFKTRGDFQKEIFEWIKISDKNQ
ncbi:MAG: transposase [Patescibacteria group bacterium]